MWVETIINQRSLCVVPVGIFINKNTVEFERVVMPFFSQKDSFLVEYIQRLIKNSGIQITVTDPNNLIIKNTLLKETIRAIEQEAPNYITLNNSVVLDGKFISQFQLMVISTYGWNKLLDLQPKWLDQTPSILIIQEKGGFGIQTN